MLRDPSGGKPAAGDDFSKSTNSSGHKPLEINITARDGFQSNQGTNVPAADIVACYANAADYGVASFQTTGGTFHDLPVKKGWNPFEFNQKILDHFSGQTQTALIRGESGLNYDRQKPDTLDYIVSRYSRMGVNRWQNFHGNNDINMMRGVPLIVNRLRDEEGLKTEVQGGICVQENPDTLARQSEILDGLYRHAEELVKTGHVGLYVKNANGVLRPDFTGALIEGLNERFDEDVHLHVHDTYGHALENYLVAIEAGVVGVDVLPDPMGGGTAQMKLGTLLHAMQNSGDSVKSRMPVGVNLAAMEQDRPTQLRIRAAYSKTEMPFQPEELAIAERAGSAGGAIGALKDMDIIKGVQQTLGTEDWPTVRRAIYEQKADIRGALGYPTNVTPFEMMQDVVAASTVMHGGKLAINTPTAYQYLSGKLGKVSETVDPDVQAQALKFYGLDAPVQVEPIENTGEALPQARQTLIDKGIENPTDDDVAIVASSGGPGLNLVLGVKEPQEPRYLLRDQQEGGIMHSAAPYMFGAAYDAVEVTRVEAGFYGDVPLDGYADQLRERIAQQVSDAREAMENVGASRTDARKASSYSKIFAGNLGADKDIVPGFDWQSFPNQRQDPQEYDFEVDEVERPFVADSEDDMALAAPLPDDDDGNTLS